MKLNLIIILLISLYPLPAASQGFKPPAEGKSVVYFTRISKFQAYAAFVLFDGDRFIADFPGQTYVRHECEPGHHVFWVSAENRSFLAADLKPGGSYIVLVDVKAGQNMPKAILSPMIVRHKDFHVAKWAITHKPPVVKTEETLISENARMAAFIQRSMAEYEQLPEEEKQAGYLSPDMALPIEKF